MPRWPAIVAASAVPLAEGRGRVVVAAPLPARTAGLREVVDVFLAERLTRAAVRAAIGAALPGGWELVDLHDEWTGAASVASLLSAADYRVRVEGAPGEALAAASERLLATATLPRESPRGTGSPPRDLRPLVLDLRVVPGDAPPPGAEPAGTLLAMRLRLGPDAVCRPEQVVAALGEPPLSTPPRPLTVVEIVRERLVLADRPAALPREAGSRAPGTPGSR